MSDRILVIAPHGSYRTAAFIDAAKHLNVDVLIASEGKHSIVSVYAQGLHIDLEDNPGSLERILGEAQRRPFVGIIGTDDSTIELAAAAARLLGLPHNSPQAVKRTRRKDMARDCLAQNGVQVPSYLKLDLRQPLSRQIRGVSYPAVVKPVILSASRGVIRVNTEAALEHACRRIDSILKTVSNPRSDESYLLLLEDFIPGCEVAVEGILYDSQLQLLAIFDKPDPLDGPYFEETYYITPSRLDVILQAQICDTIQSACLAYSLNEGPVHAECRINDKGIWVLEVAARTIGGLCARLLHFGTGYSLEELVLAHAMGQGLPIKLQQHASGVLMIPIPSSGILKRVEGILAAQRVPLIEEVDIQIRPGHPLVPLPEGSSYLGFIFAHGPDPKKVEMALRKAHACLTIVVAPVWDIKVA